MRQRVLYPVYADRLCIYGIQTLKRYNEKNCLFVSAKKA